ncbi:MAG: Inositol-pentakisphosphate 2-kinase [Claussenomyces sp. TS43310]|nr:MAG: Inositol-pentakisphosphate 2-kinase [Claussenomyces sp. TS43310]
MSTRDPVLPQNVELRYLAEGAANIVYKVDSSAAPAIFKGKLLRLRKDLPTTLPCAEAWERWNQHIRPLLAPSEMLSPELIALPDQLIARLNQHLRHLETVVQGRLDVGHPTTHRDRRPPSRHGVYLAPDAHGLLVTDMTPAGDAAVLEFKPKWLAQSPSAPSDAVRCRTCALNARREHLQRRRHAGPASPATFCPLRLASPSEDEVRKAAASLLDPQTPPPRRSSLSSDAAGSLKLAGMPDGADPDDRRLPRFCAWARESQLFHRLQHLQLSLDDQGVLAATLDPSPQSGPPRPPPPALDNLLTAMTLRDCSVFLTFPADERAPLTARLGDLDHKSPLKLDRWRTVERQLLDEGWYTATETYLSGEPPIDMDCMLSLAPARLQA